MEAIELDLNLYAGSLGSRLDLLDVIAHGSVLQDVPMSLALQAKLLRAQIHLLEMLTALTFFLQFGFQVLNLDSFVGG